MSQHEAIGRLSALFAATDETREPDDRVTFGGKRPAPYVHQTRRLKAEYNDRVQEYLRQGVISPEMLIEAGLPDRLS